MNKIVIAIVSILFLVTLGISIYTISKNNSLKDYVTEIQDRTEKVTSEFQKNQDKLNNLEVQKDKLQAVLNKVSPWLDKDYYDSVIGTKVDNENKSLFPPPPAITPRDLDNKLTSLITALQKKTATDREASKETLNRLDDLKAPIMAEFNKIFDSFEKLRGDFNAVNSINQQLHKDKEEFIISSNQKIEKLNQEISSTREDGNSKLASIKETHQNQINDLTKKYEQRISSIKDSTNIEINSIKDKLSKEKGSLKEDNQKKLSIIQDLFAELNTLTEKSFDSYYQLKKKSFTGIFFSNKKMLEDLEKEKENFYSRFNGVKEGVEKILGLSKEQALQTK